MVVNLKEWKKQEEKKFRRLQKENRRLKSELDSWNSVIELILPLLYRAFDDTILLRKKICEIEKKLLLQKINEM